MSATPTVYFIDDSATMREVIKIAFRRENINVVAYNDANTALDQMAQSPPDVVITDVIMPGKDGYEVCQFIKQNHALKDIPVILMSGVVNRAVAEKAFSVKADELIRKPFQPQDLITRVRHLLKGALAAAAPAAVPQDAAAALSSIFQSQGAGKPMPAAPAYAPPAAPPRQVMQQVPMQMQPAQVPVAAPAPMPRPAPAAPVPTAVAAPAPAPAPAAAPTRPAASPVASTGDMQKLKVEVMRLEGLVKKLQSELQAEREYARALEEHVKTLQETE